MGCRINNIRGYLTTLIPAIIFGLVGVLILAFIVRGLLTPLLGSSARGLLARWKLKNKIKALAKVDRAIEEKNLDQALLLLKDSFYLEHVKLDKRFVAYVHGHNSTALARLVICAEKRSGHIPNLGLVEGLFQSRKDLMDAFLEVLETRRAVLRKRKNQGKDIPDWGASQFNEKIEELRDNIFSNKRALKAQLQEAFKLLESLTSQEEITYH